MNVDEIIENEYFVTYDSLINSTDGFTHEEIVSGLKNIIEEKSGGYRNKINSHLIFIELQMRKLKKHL